MKSTKQPPVSFTLFFSVVFLVGVLTNSLEFKCPIDGGTGILTAAQGLKVESVELKLMGMKEFRIPRDCDLVDMTQVTYAVNMTLTNESPELNQGTVAIVFYRGQPIKKVEDDFGSDEDEKEYTKDISPSANIPFYVTIPAKTTKNIGRIFSFAGAPFAPGAEPYWATIETGSGIPCPTSDGTGKLPLTKWLKVTINSWFAS